jgi:hypothetical protein
MKLLLLTVTIAIFYPGDPLNEDWEAYRDGDWLYFRTELNGSGVLLIFYEGFPQNPIVMRSEGICVFYQPPNRVEALEIWVEHKMTDEDRNKWRGIGEFYNSYKFPSSYLVIQRPQPQ